MAKLTSRSAKVMKQLEKDGKMQILSFRESAHIDHKLATELQKIKTDFEVKEKNSRAHVAKIELASVNK